MHITLTRQYFQDGTNGTLTINGVFQCHTIELPWHNNAPRRSCIPEGKYMIGKRWSAKFGDHLLVADVPGRDLILFHAANNALKELKGCIAPVTTPIGPGQGSGSRKALQGILKKVFPTMQTTPIYLIISSTPSLQSPHPPSPSQGEGRGLRVKQQS